MKRMKPILFGLLAAFLAFNVAHADLSVTPQIPEASGGSVPLGTPFSVELIFNYTQPEGISLGGGAYGIGFYSPDGSIADVGHRNTGGSGLDGSIEFSSTWSSAFSLYNDFVPPINYDGVLPDAVYNTFISLGGLVPNTGPQTHVTFRFQVDEAAGGGTGGTLCVDSAGSGENSDQDWLFEASVGDVSFNGGQPLCITIGEISPNHPPVITCAPDPTVAVSEAVAFTVTATDEDIDDVLTFSADVLPDGASLDPNTGQFTWNTDCSDAGTYPIQFTVSDGQDTDDCTMTITVTADVTDPVITCPEDIVVDNDPGSCYAMVNFEVTATDNCPGVVVSTNYNSGVHYPQGTTEIIATATDAAGNTSTCSFNITVNEVEPPIIYCPSDIAVECGTSIDPSVTGSATAEDACDFNPIVTYSDVTDGDVVTRTWTATDAAGNSVSCDQIITIVDETDPVITCPDDLTITCTDTMVPEFTGFAVASDNCDESPTITFTDTETPGVCPQEKVVTRTWTATDDSGNTATCVQTITVVDDLAPSLTCPGDITLPFGSSTDPATTGMATATDNCSTNLNMTYSDEVNGNVITRTWTVSDECDNETSCTQSITLQGSGSPVITCPDDLTLDCRASLDPAETGTATATDDNDPEPTITYTDEVTPGDCDYNFVLARTWSAEDDDGNISTCIQTITVQDIDAPAITCPDDVTIDCAASTDPEFTGYPTVEDFCDGTPVVTFSDASGDGTIVRTWTATDICGNAATCDQIITIEDNTAPVISECPIDITVTCVLDTLADNTGTPVFTDDCDSQPTLTWASVVTEGTCINDFIVTRTFTVTDESGNSSTCVQTITVFDDVAPVITCPDDIQVAFDGSTEPDETGYPEVTENCDGDVEVTYADVNAEEIISRTWTATDACGNSASCTQLITILPMPDPTIGTDPTVFDFTLIEGEILTGISMDVFETLNRNISFSVFNYREWLTLNDAFPQTTPHTITFDIDATDVQIGDWADTLQIISGDAVNSPVQVVVNITVEPAVAPPDSVWVSTVPGVPGSHIVVPVYFRNNDPLGKISLPMTWNSNALILDSVSFLGTRVSSVDNNSYIHNEGLRQVLITVDPVFSDLIPSGRGLLAKLHFKVYDFIPTLPATVVINKTVIGMDGYLYFEDEFGAETVPVFTPGGAVIDEEAGQTCGRVIDIFGNEIEGATVELWDDFPAGAMMTSLPTDINGQFTCGTLGVVPFDAYAHKDGYYPGLVEDIDYDEIGFDIILTPVSDVHESPDGVDFFSGENCLSYYQNLPLPVGSVVDGFNPDGIHCGTAYVTTPGVYNMRVYGDDPRTTEKDGAYPGEEISFFINGYPANAAGNTAFMGNGPLQEVCLDLFRVDEVVIDLDAGWNLISWNVDTPTDDVEELFADIMDDVEVILGFEQGGFTFDPILPEFSTLQDCDHLHGFWVKMYNPRTLILNGSPIAATTPISLEFGWNLVSYLPNEGFAPDYALGSVHDMLDVAMGWKDGGPETYDPFLPEYATLTEMAPKFGYWLNMDSDVMLVYPGAGPLVSFKQIPVRMNMAAKQNAVAASRIWVDAFSRQLTLDGLTISGGTQIKAITSDGLVVGAGTVATDGKFGFMPIYGDDPMTDAIEGPSSGQTISFVVGNVETNETFVWDADNRTVEISALTAKGGSDDPALPSEYGLHQNYPNPFNPSTTISFSMPSSGKVSIEVYNILGARVATVFDGMAEAGTTSVIWDGRNENGEQVATGIYFSRMKCDQFEQSRKMVLMK